MPINAVGHDGGDAPAVIIVGADNKVRAANPAGRALIRELGGTGTGDLPAALAPARAGGGPEAGRVRTPSGRRLVARSTVVEPAHGTEPSTVITVEEAGPAEPSALGGYGLTKRERQIAGLVLRGMSTRAIAGALYVSPYTVQDHLKSIFAKVGVRSRHELVATAFFGARREADLVA